MTLILALDIVRILAVVAVVAVAAHQLLGVLRDARWLDDAPDSPGARNDRARLMEDRIQ